MTPASDVLRQLFHIGVIQFGRFEDRHRPGTFAPMAVNVGLLPSYPAVLTALAHALVPLIRPHEMTHLLATATATPLGVALSLAASMPLVYPSPYAHHEIEGAYDFNVPTLLLTTTLTDGVAEQRLVKHARGEGLHVEAILALFALHAPSAQGTVPVTIWQPITTVLDAALQAGKLTPAFRRAVEMWLEDISQA